jgi:hypothetical protein
VTHKVITCVTNQRVTSERQINVPHANGWEIKPTSVTTFGLVDQCGDLDTIDFVIQHDGKSHTYFENPIHTYPCTHHGPGKLFVNFAHHDSIDTQIIRTSLDDVMLMDLMYFDKNARLITRIPMIDGWWFEIKYFNYDVPRPVKRQRTS